jgi:hypothetical protein
MNEAKGKATGIASDTIIALAFAVFGGLWLAAALFFLTDAIGDYREAHSPEIGAAPSWTWRDTFQRVGIGGLFFGFVPPTILLGYGVYFLCRTVARATRQLTPKLQ